VRPKKRRRDGTRAISRVPFYVAWRGYVRLRPCAAACLLQRLGEDSRAKTRSPCKPRVSGPHEPEGPHTRKPSSGTLGFPGCQGGVHRGYLRTLAEAQGAIVHDEAQAGANGRPTWQTHPASESPARFKLRRPPGPTGSGRRGHLPLRSLRRLPRRYGPADGPEVIEEAASYEPKSQDAPVCQCLRVA
jgi:hypothetical protein